MRCGKASRGDGEAALAMEQSAGRGDNPLVTAKAAKRIAQELRDQATAFETLADETEGLVLVAFTEDEWAEVASYVRRACR